MMSVDTVFVDKASQDRSGIINALSRSSLPNQLCRQDKIVIKVNFVSSYVPLCATPVEAVESFLKALPGSCLDKTIIIEAPSGGSFREAIERYGYTRLADEYGVELVDLAGDDFEEFYVWSRNLEKDVLVRVSKTILEAKALVSIVRPKTHDTVVVTLSIKNVVVGAIMPGYRSRIHQGYKAINLTLAYLATKMMPNLALIDGYVGMEGNGPVGGEPKPLGLVLIGSNALETDALTAWLMGFNPNDIGYFYYLHRWGYGEITPDKIRVDSNIDWKSYRTRFKPHRLYLEQLKWRLAPEEERKVERQLEKNL